MTEPNLYAIGRLGMLPGIEMTPALHPQRIPPRTRAAVKRMIQEGHISGGWQSKSAKLASTLCDQFRLPFVRNRCSLEIPREASHKIRTQIADMFCADQTAFTVEHGAKPAASAQYQKYREQILDPSQAQPWVYFQSKAMQRHAAALLGQELVAAHEPLRQQVCGLLDGVEPIPIQLENAPAW